RFIRGSSCMILLHVGTTRQVPQPESSGIGSKVSIPARSKLRRLDGAIDGGYGGFAERNSSLGLRVNLRIMRIHLRGISILGTNSVHWKIAFARINSSHWS